MTKSSLPRARGRKAARAAEERRESIKWSVKTAHAAVLTAIQCLDGRGVVDTALAHTLRAAALKELDKVLEVVMTEAW